MLTYSGNIYAGIETCFILKGEDLLDDTSIFLLRNINHSVIPIICILS